MSSASGPGTVAGSVNVGIMENGDRTEEYYWELPSFYSLARQNQSITSGSGVPLAKPIFPQGVFGDPAWREKFNGTFLHGDLRFGIPYPEESSSSPYHAWKLSIASVGLNLYPMMHNSQELRRGGILPSVNSS